MLQCITTDPDYGALTRGLLGRGYTTRELGLAVGLSQPSVSRLATGRTKAISADVALRLIRLVGGQILLPDPPKGDPIARGRWMRTEASAEQVAEAAPLQPHTEQKAA